MRSWLAVSLLGAVLVGCGDNRVPDGALVFAAALEGAASTDLYVIAGDGSGLQRLTETPGDERFPRWSPDRSEIAYLVGDELFVVGSDGAGARRVAGPVGRDGVGLTAPDWSPDGSQLVYAAPRPPRLIEGQDESYATIFHLVNSDGSADVPLGDSGRTMSEPAWSADGWLALRDADDCPDCAGDEVLALVRDDGTGYHVVETDNYYAAPYPQHDLDWAPGSARWVYTTGSPAPYESPGQIAVSDGDGAGAVILVDGGAHMPRWSPAAEHIGFLQDDGIHVMAADGGGAQRVFAAEGIRGLDW